MTASAETKCLIATGVPVNLIKSAAVIRNLKMIYMLSLF